MGAAAERTEHSAAGRRVRLALDHHYSWLIAEQLRTRGHDAVAAIERGWEQEDDETLLAHCDSEHRVLMTNNVGDFTIITRRWAAQGRSHAGLIFTSDAALPRTHHTIGKYIKLLAALFEGDAESAAWIDRIHWL